MSNTSPPKLFISYSWTTSAHERWVIELAERLVDDNIEVILDKWDLREGHDAHAFMERMVTDPDIKKVAMICDVAYANKADKRGGGVGTETQIITGEIYSNTAQDKFVAVIAEKDADGHAAVPAYYKSRIHIDLTDADRYEQEYERLVRWVYDKSLYVKPSLGKTPDFLTDTAARTLGNRSAMKRALDHLREGKPTATAALVDYLSSVAVEFGELRIVKDATTEFDEQVIRSIESFRATRDDVLAVIQAVARYQPTEENLLKIHRFFEELLGYYGPPSNVNSYSDWDFDNFIFVTHELFLHTIAIFIDGEHFEQARTLIATEFYVANSRVFGGNPMVSAAAINSGTGSLDRRNERLKLQRTSLRGDLLHDRCKSAFTRFESLAQADVLLFMHFKRAGAYWWPYTVIYLGPGRAPMPVFARASSTKFFNKLRVLFGLDTGEQMRAWIERLAADDRLPQAGYTRLPVEWLTAADTIATKE
ncbi:TIR domain-containing protein [Paraburkholderia fungorum]|uniref:SEFIR domain-containing protein n=1 Tax=Paraburkholderia fungorum TaxID=134537 RepID=UPI0038B6E77A